MMIHETHRGVVKNKRPLRLGRGPGSGQGKTGGRGGKGQTARAGYNALSIFQGGGSPLVRRVPKRGFTNSFAMTVAAVNVSDLEKCFAADSDVNPDSLRGTSLVQSSFDVLKILGDGELTKRLKVSAHRFSASAKEKIEKAGGQVIVLPGRTSVEEKKRAKRAAKPAKK